MAEVTVVLVDDHPVVHDGVRAWLEQDPERRVALVAAGVAVVQLLPEGEPDAESYIVGVPLIALGTVLPVLSLRRWGDNERAMRFGRPLPHTRLREVLAWWIVATTVLAVIVLVARDAT